MGNISVDYDVLNQKGSPAWYSDLFANIPTPGYKGRMFISTDTFAFYRDNGVGWDLVGGPGTGTITGAGVFGQVTFFSGTDTISGNTDFVWDNTNKRLGINTGTPGAPLDIHSTGTAAQFNGTTTNNAFVLFQNAGTSKWRIGNLYNSGANDYQIYDVLNATARLTIKNTGATTLTGTFTATSLIKSGGTSSQILLADGTTTPTSTFGAGSVTSVSAITLGTSGTDLSSSVANSTTTPVITLNVPTASATNRGALSSADWTTFNSKQSTITLTTTGTSGAATLVGATLNIPNYTNVGTVTSVAALTLGTTGTDLSSSVANSTSTPVITLNVPTASATNRGALSTTDWTTFNNKQATISVTAPVVLTGATISMPAATTSVSGYLTSTDWNTFNNKTSNLGTVTDVVALTIGTTGIDITSTAVTTTTTPVITLNIPTASASNRGALSSTDWTTFNNKQATLSLTTTGTSGAATLVANTLNVPNYGSALSGYLPLTGGTLTGALNGTSASFSSSLNTDTKLQLALWDAINWSGSTLKVGGVTSSQWQQTDIFTNGVSRMSVSNSAITLYQALSGTSATFSGNVNAVTYKGSTFEFYVINNAATSNLLHHDGTNLYSLGNIYVNGNGFSTGTAVISGTGTTNYLPKFTGASTIGNSLITDTGSVITLGTGQINLGTTGSIFYIFPAFSTNLNLLQSYNGSAYTTEEHRASDYSYKIGTTTAMLITSGSRVGIGQTAPGVALSVAGQTETWQFGVTTATGTAGALIGSPSANVLAFGNWAGTESMRISANGNLGIATTNPDYKLDINSSTSYKTLMLRANAIGTRFDVAIDFNAINVNTYPYARIGLQITGASAGSETGGLTFWTINSGSFTEKLAITGGGIINAVSRGNFLGATDNALFSLNSGGTLYTVGFSPTATASSTNTLTLTTGTTTWIYTGTGTATWTLPNPSGNNQIYWIKNAGTGIITLNAYSGTNIINNAAASVSSITIAVGSTAVIAQDGNVKSYQLQ